ncbi:ctlh domain-containing protein [Coniella lustricola]|uniref:Ctlh domain-containing protein n=1 Tax=Coniella lustricola TaxID=2025994 RepID=A0A2T3ABS4_9PEZI|nr:ctlh domain-containing protein [Coniella lustricola]
MTSGGPPAIDFQPPGSDDVTFWANFAAEFRLKFGDMTSTTSTATPVRHVFEARVMETKAPKSDINLLILDYLTMEGYPLAAAKFSKEANLNPHQEDPAIKARQQIKNSIHQGKIMEAIEALNDLDPEILDKDARLHFSLLRLQLIELIRNSEDGDRSMLHAIRFASQQLGPRVPKNPEFLTQLEETMALFLYPRNELRPEQQALLHPDLRREVADKVNMAIIMRQTKRREAAIRQLVKVRTWAEDSARSAKKDLPDRLELGLHGDDIDNAHETGSEAMITC